jgi:SAM-dependent methyltransferase
MFIEMESRYCIVCGLYTSAAETQLVRCNVRKFHAEFFLVWRCMHCRSIHGPSDLDLDPYYKNYPIRSEKLDYFLRVWYQNILCRLQKLGISKYQSLLDYGCNQGLWLTFLKSKGFNDVSGYDSYVEHYQSLGVLNRTYDWVFCADVIEHDKNPQEFLRHLKQCLNPNGKIVILTPNADGIDINRPEEFLHSLHQPYHCHLLSHGGLTMLAEKLGLYEVHFDDRWYMDSAWPGTSQKLVEMLLEKSGNDIDAGYEPPRIDLFFKHPQLIWYLFFGYFVKPKKKDHMMCVFINKSSLVKNHL